MSRLFVLIQYLLPHHFLSRFVGFFAESSLFKNFFIKLFIRRYKVNLDEAAIADATEYPNFNTFFTRELKPDARPFPNNPEAIISPADGTISAMGEIRHDQLIQAKNHQFSLIHLLAGDSDLANHFFDGSFVTVYLSPKDYHRVHLPIAGQLVKTLYVPGRLFSVNRATTELVPNLFARNERAICVFSTAIGPLCVILVGAMIVAGIETVWGGQLCPKPGARIVTTSDYRDNSPPIEFAAGAEIGRFKLGSTAIVLCPPGSVQLSEELCANSPIKMGQQIGKLLS